MLRSVKRLLQSEFSIEVDWTMLIHSDHNHMRRESHFGGEFWVHRKGAPSAAEGEEGASLDPWERRAFRCRGEDAWGHCFPVPMEPVES